MLQACPSTRARDKSQWRLVICPGTKSVDAVWPVRAVDDMVVHQDPTLANDLGQVAVEVSVRRHWFPSAALQSLVIAAASYTAFPNT
jgi:hypothetical protein